MATGEKKFSTSGREVVKFQNTPIAVGDYELKLIADTVKIGKRPEPGKFPYVQIAFEALDTAAEEGQKNRRVYHMFFLSTKPAKNGMIMVDRADQVVGFCKGLGEEAAFPMVPMLGEDKREYDVIHPKAIEKFLKERDGVIVKAHIKIRKDKEYGDKNVIDYFEEVAVGSSSGPDDDAPADEVEGDVEITNDSDEYGELPADEEVEEVEEVKPAPKKAAPAPVRKATPPAKAVAKKR